MDLERDEDESEYLLEDLRTERTFQPRPSSVRIGDTKSSFDVFSWNRKAVSCGMWNCPLDIRLSSSRVESEECDLCLQQVPVICKLPCLVCSHRACVVCHLRVVSAKSIPSVVFYDEMSVGCSFCRSKYPPFALAQLNLIFEAHEAEIPFELWRQVEPTQVASTQTVQQTTSTDSVHSPDDESISEGRYNSLGSRYELDRIPSQDNILPDIEGIFPRDNDSTETVTESQITLRNSSQTAESPVFLESAHNSYPDQNEHDSVTNLEREDLEDELGNAVQLLDTYYTYTQEILCQIRSILSQTRD